MKVLIAYPFYTRLITDDSLFYLPEIANLGEDDLCRAIVTYEPNVLVVGNNKISGSTINTWRKIKGENIELAIVRRGTSLAKVDTLSASKASIEVINTPGINAPFVADYVLQELGILNDNFLGFGLNKRLAVIGSGNIGSRIARQAARAGYDVIVHSPSLALESTRELAVASKQLNIPNIEFAITPSIAVQGADLVVLAINAENIKNPADKLDNDFVSMLKENVKILSISENKVFTDDALKQLINRANNRSLFLIIDSTPQDIIELKFLAKNLINITLGSNAMKDPSCQIFMDQAVLVTLADLALKYLSLNSFAEKTKYIPNKKHITIIGAGISGLMTSLALERQGYKITVLDSIPDPTCNMDKEYAESTSWDSCDARHLSLSETIPHAASIRSDALKKNPLHGGWQLNQNYNDHEELWAKQFEQLAKFPELQNIFTRFVTNLNYRGIKIWEQIFREYPEITGNSIQSKKVVRIYKSNKSLEGEFIRQSTLHRVSNTNSNVTITKLSKNEILERFPGLDGNEIAGGIEVMGFILNLHTFCNNLRRYLESRQVRFHWNSKVTNIATRGDETEISLSDGRVFSGGEITIVTVGHYGHHILKNTDITCNVQGVIGFWVILPNLSNILQGFKIHEDDPIGVMNATISHDKKEIYISGGFGYIGQNDLPFDNPQVQNLCMKFKAAVERYLPDQYKTAVKNGTLKPKFCTRPMTPDGIPIVQFVDKNNKQIYFSGTNSGGFVEAPILASILTAGMMNEEEILPGVSHILKVLNASRYSLCSIDESTHLLSIL